MHVQAYAITIQMMRKNAFRARKFVRSVQKHAENLLPKLFLQIQDVRVWFLAEPFYFSTEIIFYNQEKIIHTVKTMDSFIKSTFLLEFSMLIISWEILKKEKRRKDYEETPAQVKEEGDGKSVQNSGDNQLSKGGGYR